MAEARRPAGTPAGGQFAPSSHSEPTNVDLDVAAETPGFDQRDAVQVILDERAAWADRYNSEGTFSFPPAPADPLQVARFWSAVAVPDAVLAQFQSAYPAARQRLLAGWVNQAMAKDPEPTVPVLGRTKKYLAAHAEWAKRRAAVTADMAKHLGPERLAAHQVRPAVRGIMLARQLKQLPPDDRYMPGWPSADEWLDFDDAGPTYRLIEQHYAVSQMPESVFRDPNNDVGARLGELSSTMQSALNELAALRDGHELEVATRGARSQREFEQMARAAGFEKG